MILALAFQLPFRVSKPTYGKYLVVTILCYIEILHTIVRIIMFNSPLFPFDKDLLVVDTVLCIVFCA